MGYQRAPSAADQMVGRNIRRIRCEKGISAEEVASYCGGQSLYLPAIEAGLVRPSAMTLLSLAEVLKCKLSDMFVPATSS
jgi:transcriptional regulator with XRE-family HTH domain